MSGTTVIKVGGSLFRRPGLAESLAAWRRDTDALDGADRRVWIAGGGDAVEALRQIDAVNPCPAEATHFAAIAMMDANARLLSAWLGDAPTTECFDELHDERQADRVFAPGRFLRDGEPSLAGEPLPIGWEATSDAIAARLAGRLGADLVLLKSAPPGSWSALPPADAWRAAAAEGYVDPAFPAFAAGLPRVRAVLLP